MLVHLWLGGLVGWLIMLALVRRVYGLAVLVVLLHWCRGARVCEHLLWLASRKTVITEGLRCGLARRKRFLDGVLVLRLLRHDWLNVCACLRVVWKTALVIGDVRWKWPTRGGDVLVVRLIGRLLLTIVGRRLEAVTAWEESRFCGLLAPWSNIATSTVLSIRIIEAIRLIVVGVFVFASLVGRLAGRELVIWMRGSVVGAFDLRPFVELLADLGRLHRPALTRHRRDDLVVVLKTPLFGALGIC